jgi:hypothetical protein
MALPSSPPPSIPAVDDGGSVVLHSFLPFSEVFFQWRTITDKRNSPPKSTTKLGGGSEQMDERVDDYFRIEGTLMSSHNFCDIFPS